MRVEHEPLDKSHMICYDSIITSENTGGNETMARELAFGEILRELRVKAGFSLRAFARKIEMQSSNLRFIENGRVNPPRDKDALLGMATALGLRKRTPDWGKFFDAAVQD